GKIENVALRLTAANQIDHGIAANACIENANRIDKIAKGGNIQHSSPNLSAMSAPRASSTTSASSPDALTSMQQPGEAASIISPMMEVPPTTMPSLETRTWAL